MKAVHAILVLKHRPDNLESHRLDANSTHTQRQLCYLRQPGQDGGAAGGAAADRRECVVEQQTTLSQSAQVGSMNHRVIIHLCLKTCIISWVK